MRPADGCIKFVICLLFCLQVSVSLGVGATSQWGSWSPWSKCPEECGPAISVRNRLCQSENNGHPTTTFDNCPGQDIQRRLCQNNACLPSEPSPRQKACSKYDHRIFSGKQYVWEPFMHLSDACKLSCRAKDAHFYANLAEKVQDGVECGKYGILAVCVRGVCQPVGCDNVVQSTARKDKCGQCNGDGSTCKTISGIFTSTQLTRGLNHILTIPARTTSINITELIPSKNLLVLQTAAGKAFINADPSNPTSGTFQAAGTSFKYSAKTSINPREAILAEGPTNATLILKIYSRGSNPGIMYTLSVSHNVSDSYIKQITSNSAKPLVQEAPVYIEEKDTDTRVPHTKEDAVDEERNFLSESDYASIQHNDKNDGEMHNSHPSNVDVGNGVADKVAAPSVQPIEQTTSSPLKETTRVSSNFSDSDENSRSITNSGTQLGSQDFGDESDGVSQEEAEVSGGESDSLGKESNARVLNNEDNQVKPISTGNDESRTTIGAEDNLRTSTVQSKNTTEEILSSDSLSENSENEQDTAIGDRRTTPRTTAETTTRKPSVIASPFSSMSKGYKIPRYSQSFKFGEKYKNLNRRQNRRRNGRKQGHGSRSRDRSKEREEGDRSGHQSNKHSHNKHHSSVIANDDNKHIINDQQGHHGPILSQRPHRHRPEPRGDYTSALESRPESVRTYRYQNQRNERRSSYESYRDRQARIQERRRRLRQQREEYHRRLRERRERHEKQLKRRWQRGRRKQSSSQQRYTRIKLRTRAGTVKTTRSRMSPVEATTIVNVKPSKSRLNGFSSQSRSSVGRSASGPEDTSKERRVPIRIQPKPVRIIPRVPISREKEELVSQTSRSDSKSAEEGSPSEQKFVKPTPTQQILNTTGVQVEISTMPVTKRKEEESPDESQPQEESASSSSTKKDASSSSILNTPRVISRVRSKEADQRQGIRKQQPPSYVPREREEPRRIIPARKTNQDSFDQTRQPQPPSSVRGENKPRPRIIPATKTSRDNFDPTGEFRPRQQPPPTFVRENEDPQRVIPATNTNQDNIIIPNSRLTAEQLPPNVISGRQLQPESVLGYTSYEWRISGLTECTHSCGGGVQQTVVVCVAERTQAVVTDENCADVEKPEIKAVTCNKRPCPAKWVPSPWSSCSVTCGEGQQTRTVICQTRVSPTLNLTMPETSCEHLEKPVDVQNCKKKPCNTWKIGEWSECSAHCGDGVKTRLVQCLDVNQKVVPDDQCPELKPSAEEECKQGSCGKGWFVTAWPKECPVACGKGQVTRKIFCASDEGEALPESRCDASKRPKTQRPCRATLPCGGSWFAGEWSKCNSTCGPSAKIRDVLCIKKVPGNVFAVVEEENCNIEEKPKQEEPCTFSDCKPQWYMTSWGECSQSCATGYRTRELKCLNTQQKPSDQCSQNERPRTREPCNTQSCENDSSTSDLNSDTNSECKDKFAQCRIVKRARLCRYGYYTKMCCKSCSGQS